VTSTARRLRILFLLPFAPRTDARHGGRALAHVLAALAPRHEIRVLHLRSSAEGPADDLIRTRGGVVEEISVSPLPASPAGRTLRAVRVIASLLRGRPLQVFDFDSRRFAARVRVAAADWQPDIVHIELEAMAQYLSSLDGSRAARVLAAHEPSATTAREVFDASRGADRLLRFLDLRAWEKFSRRALPRVDRILVFTDQDARALERFAPGVPATVIPLRVPAPSEPLDPVGVDPPTALFVGGFGHAPNVDAAERLATAIFPTVHANLPDVVLEIVGDKPPHAVRALARDGVRVAGAVPDVTPYLDRAAVFIAPVRVGGGMRLKVIEALAAGKAVVASPLAVRGLDVRDGEHVLLAETDAEFADALTLMLSNAEDRAALAARAREWACTHLDVSQTVFTYENLYASLDASR
jgi:glycosyltransferase involved in cell wall biosynthesis